MTSEQALWFLGTFVMCSVFGFVMGVVMSSFRTRSEAEKLVRIHFVDKILEDLSRIQAVAGTTGGTPYVGNILRTVRAFRDVLAGRPLSHRCHRPAQRLGCGCSLGNIYCRAVQRRAWHLAEAFASRCVRFGR